jgi:hypothetical protein
MEDKTDGSHNKRKPSSSASNQTAKTHVLGGPSFTILLALSSLSSSFC